MQSHFKDDAEQIFGSWVLAILLLVALAGLSLVAEDEALAAKGASVVAEDAGQPGFDL